MHILDLFVNDCRYVSVRMCYMHLIVLEKRLNICVLLMLNIGAMAFKEQYLFSNNQGLNVQCTGTETDLSQCTIEPGSCSFYNFAGISCQPSKSHVDFCLSLPHAMLVECTSYLTCQ